MQMKVKIVKNYFDTTKKNELIKAGTELSVSAERGKVLIESGVAVEIPEVKEETKKKNK